MKNKEIYEGSKIPSTDIEISKNNTRYWVANSGDGLLKNLPLCPPFEGMPKETVELSLLVSINEEINHMNEKLKDNYGNINVCHLINEKIKRYRNKNKLVSEYIKKEYKNLGYVKVA